jgi:hypothetical protein
MLFFNLYLFFRGKRVAKQKRLEGAGTSPASPQ